MPSISDDGTAPVRRGGASRGAFTVLELLLVIMIIVLVATFAVPAINSTLIAMRLTTAAETATSLIASARQSAIAANHTVEVRFYRYAAQNEPGEQLSNPATGCYRAFQIFQFDDAGSAIPLTKVEQLPEGMIFDSGSLSPLLATIPPKTFNAALDTQIALPACGTDYICTAYQIFPSGNTTLPAGQWYVTLHRRTDGDALSSAPSNYATIQVDPISGAIRSYRP